MGNTYDEIFQCFLDNCGHDFDDIPQSDELRYRMIRNSIKLYNQKAKKYSSRMQGDVECNDEFENINKRLTDTEMLILSNIIAYVLTKNKLAEFSSIYSVFAKELGINNYNAQVKARESVILSYKKEIDRLIEDEIDSFTL